MIEISRFAAAGAWARSRKTSPYPRKPNRLSEPTFRNARRSKSSYMATSMIENECLGVKYGPQGVFERLPPRLWPPASSLNGGAHQGHLAFGGRMHQSR